MYYVRKEFECEIAHLLYKYDGACKNIHGHTYKFQIVVMSEELDNLGMVIDFKKLKTIFEEEIKNKWDHALLINENDQEMVDVIKSLQDRNIKIFLCDGNPTAEWMSKYLHDVFYNRLYMISSNNLMVTEASVYETPTSKATYTKEY